MYNIKVQDSVDIKEVKTSFDINDLIHICKRCNNTKREYLFVNKWSLDEKFFLDLSKPATYFSFFSFLENLSFKNEINPIIITSQP